MATSQPQSGFEPKDRLLHAGFLGLLLTQFLTAVNDNTFRWLVIGIGKQYVPDEHVPYVLVAATAFFVAPYLVLAATAGFLADRFPKRRVVMGCKALEIAVMAVGVLAILIASPQYPASLGLLFFVVLLMGAQSAIFSPARLGSIPELLHSEKISSANGVMGLVTVIAAVIGMALGNLLTDWTQPLGKERWWLSALVLVGTAVAGWVATFPIRTPAAANPKRKFPWNGPSQTWRDLKILAASRALLRVAFGVMFFWAVGSLTQMNIDEFAFAAGATQQAHVVPLLLALVAGVGAGSVCAGIWSQGRVELGIVPLGAAIISASGILLYTVSDVFIYPGALWTVTYIWVCVLLFGLGFGAGLFDVPLTAYLQHRSPPEWRGAILAASNFLTFGGILLVAGLFAFLRSPVIDLAPHQLFLICGLVTIPVLVYIVYLVPQATIRFLVWLASSTVYRIRVFGREHLPQQGGALLAPNHVSWIDGILLLLTSSRPIRMVVWAGNFQSRWLQSLAHLYGAIMILPRPKSIALAIRTAREALENGELVCIFPEGGITRSGHLQTFKPGMMKIVDGLDVPVIPVYLDELWGSIFSFKGGRFFWKRPRRLPYPVSIHFGCPLRQPKSAYQVRQAVEELGAIAVQKRASRMMHLTKSFIRRCKDRRSSPKVADSMGTELSGGQLLLRTLILRRLLRRHVLADDEKYVGVLLPPSVPAVAVNMALALDKRISANLNYTISEGVMKSCIDQAGIRHVLTSRRFMDKMNFKLEGTEVVYLEDLKDKPTLADKLAGAAGAYAMPTGMLEKSLGLEDIQSDDVLTVIFTSGSTGTPKGVMLTYGNVGSNVEAIDQVVRLTKEDVLIGLLPFFHVFGYTVTLWTVMAIDVKGVYHFNPLDGRQVGELCQKHGGTLLLSTPTFLRNYLRRATPEQFKTLEVVVAGAEKLPSSLCDAFEEKFGVRPVEGYGTTELSPLVSVNIPPARSPNTHEVDLKEGTVGRPVPGVSAKITDLETGEVLGPDQSGMLWIKGPNVMKGYLGRDDLTAEVIVDGWYKTGDVAKIDADGFITITGRESRFSKLGGEMVPHGPIEEALNKIIGVGEEEGLKAAVTAVPDEKKGERLVVVHTAIEQSPDQLREALAKEGLPNLYLPGADRFCQVDELPVLGSGKLDLKAIQQIALERFGPKKDAEPSRK